MSVLKRSRRRVSAHYASIDEKNIPVDSPLKTVRSNIVQSIQAFQVEQLKTIAQQVGYHFLYADLSTITSTKELLSNIGDQYNFPDYYVENFDALYDCLTDTAYKNSPNSGMILILEQIPLEGDFDVDRRELLLDVFRDAADFWGDKKLPFRCFYSFLVAKEESILTDISPIALGLSSPFNPSYWSNIASSS